MNTITIDGVRFAVEDFACLPWPPSGLVEEVRFRLPGTQGAGPVRVGHYVPIAFDVNGDRYAGFFRLVERTVEKSHSEYKYAGSARPRRDELRI